MKSLFLSATEKKYTIFIYSTKLDTRQKQTILEKKRYEKF